MHIRPLSIGAALAAGLFATATTAQSPGEMTIAIDGNDPDVLTVTVNEWNGVERQPWIWIDTVAPGENSRDRLSVGLHFAAVDWVASEPELTLLRFEDGEVTQRLWAFGEPERGGLTVTIESHALDGRELTLTGHFEGTLGTSRTKGREVDLSEGLPVSGTFSVMLVEQD